MGMETLLILGAAGTGLQIAGTLKQGRQAQEIAEARAAVDIQHAQAVDEATDEKAKILEKKRLRAVEAAASVIGSSGVRLGGPLDLVTEADINATFWADKNFSTKSGRAESSFFRSRAGIEKATGALAKKQSKWAAISQGITGFGSIAMLGVDAGLFGGSSPGISPSTARAAGTGLPRRQ